MLNKEEMIEKVYEHGDTAVHTRLANLIGEFYEEEFTGKILTKNEFLKIPNVGRKTWEIYKEIFVGSNLSFENMVEDVFRVITKYASEMDYYEIFGMIDRIKFLIYYKEMQKMMDGE